VLEFIVVDAPLVAPHTCVGCNSGKGPMVDTHRELVALGGSAGGRVYLCGLCVRRAARVFGYVEGARMDELVNLDETLGLRDKELEDVGAVLKEAIAYGVKQRQRAEQAEREVEDATNLARTLEHRLSDVRGAIAESVA